MAANINKIFQTSKQKYPSDANFAYFESQIAYFESRGTFSTSELLRFLASRLYVITPGSANRYKKTTTYFFQNLLPLCHQPIANALFMGKIGWWQMGGKWQQNGLFCLFSTHKVLRTILCFAFLEGRNVRKHASKGRNIGRF